MAAAASRVLRELRSDWARHKIVARRCSSNSTPPAAPPQVITRLEQLRSRLAADAAATAIPAKPAISSAPVNIHSEGSSGSRELVDTYERKHTYLRISLTEKCNLRCTYCMPVSGVDLSPTPNLLTTDEIIHTARHFVDMGVTKIRLTGGEPMVRKDVLTVVARLKSLDGLRTLGMTSNGVLLSQAKLKDLKSAGLTHLNISLDTFDRDKFVRISHREPAYHDRALKSIYNALEAGFSPLKVCSILLPYEILMIYCSCLSVTGELRPHSWCKRRRNHEICCAEQRAAYSRALH
jgi:uncharacterized radical SAM superfamily Fe-S cluster-containing enzyme